MDADYIDNSKTCSQRIECDYPVDVELTDEDKVQGFETWKHIYEVQKLLSVCRVDLERRSLEHDQSKLQNEEIKYFTEFTPKLKGVKYGSEEYKQFLEDLKPALDNHYKKNSHHPEHYESGVEGMNLLDILEMLCDWKASSMRTKDGDIRKSLVINKDRFGMSEQLVKIMENTLDILER